MTRQQYVATSHWVGFDEPPPSSKVVSTGQWADAFVWLQRLLEDVERDPAPGPNRLNLWFWVPRLYANDLEPLRQNPNFPGIERQIEDMRQAQIAKFAPLD